MIDAALSVLETDEQRTELSIFYEKYKTNFYGIAFSHLNKHELVEDAIQDAFVKIAKKPKIFFDKNEKDRLAYCAIIVRNTAVDIYKKEKKIAITELRDGCTENNLSVEDIVIGDISKDELLKLIKNMTEANRQVMFLKLHFNLRYAEIADELGISETAVRKRASTAMKQIKDYLEEKRNG